MCVYKEFVHICSRNRWVLECKNSLLYSTVYKKSGIGASLDKALFPLRGSEPEQDLQLGGAAGRLLALEGDGRLVGALQALLHFSQHALVDGRVLVGRGDVVHAAEGGRLALAAVRVHRGEVHCEATSQAFSGHINFSCRSFFFLWLWATWKGGRKNARAGSGTVDVEGVAVFGTLVATLAEEVHHVLRLTAEDQLSTAHDGYPAEHLEHTIIMIRFNKISNLVQI